jgi:molybdate transport system substrate-binding protein
MWLRPALVFVCAASLAGCGDPRQTANGPSITVAAAVSLTESLTEVAAAWRAETGQELTFNFAGSNTLARQILQGAPADVFVSADAVQMDRVEAGGAIVPGTRAAIARNRLVVVIPGAGRPRWPTAAPLESDAIATVALGNPDAVPAGAYAKAWLERVGLWERMRDRVVPMASVRAALAAVETGAADAAVVYRTDAGPSTRRTVVYEVPEAESPEIVYYAGVVKDAPRVDDARAFVSFLAGERGSAILSRHGFSSVR